MFRNFFFQESVVFSGMFQNFACSGTQLKFLFLCMLFVNISCYLVKISYLQQGLGGGISYGLKSRSCLIFRPDTRL